MKVNYDHLAGRYDEDRARYTVPRDDIIDELLASRSSIRVLDLGSGTGTWLATQRELFRDSRVTWLGADRSWAMLAEARAKEVGNMLLAQAEGLPLLGMSADYVTCSYSFHQFADKDRALDEVARVLRRGGVFRMNNINPSAAEGWWLYQFFPETIALDAARFWPASRIAEALEARGFAVDIEFESGSEEVAIAEAVADAERRVISQLALLNDSAYDRGLAHLRQAAAANRTTTVTAIEARLHVTARRTR
jgi:ubiquinone/menaquinone biosynthesis C-methylase UbiE